MEQREYPEDKGGYFGGLWTPGQGFQSGEDQVSAYPPIPEEVQREINQISPQPVAEKHVEAHWTIKDPETGLFLKASAVKRPTGGGDFHTTYGLQILRFSEVGPGDPLFLTRSDMTRIRDFVAFVLEDSEG